MFVRLFLKGQRYLHTLHVDRFHLIYPFTFYSRVLLDICLLLFLLKIHRKYVHVIGINPAALLSLLINCELIIFVHISMCNSFVMSGIVTYGQKKNS